MLKRHGCRDVLTFSYGRPGNREAEASRAAAGQLGYPWHFVPYSRDRWRGWFATPEMARYLPFCARHVAAPHVQDWPAVLELRRRGVLEAGAVAVPGHTAFLTSANRLDRSVAALSPERRVDAVAALLFRHNYTLQSARRAGTSTGSMRRRIARLIDGSAAHDMHRLLNAFFAFEATERHAKLIANSVRVYEFWELSWALPLWDDRLVRLWARVPYERRLDKEYFREFASRVNLYELFPRPGPPPLSERLLQAAKANRGAYVALRQLRCLEERVFGYFHHFLDWYGIVSYPGFLYHMGRCGNIYSLLSRLYLRTLGR
jgi:asparagine synthase (glutamine-hydrolysing)